MGHDLWCEGFVEKCVLSLEWKRVGVMDGESGDDGTGEHGWVEWEEYEGEWLGWRNEWMDGWMDEWMNEFDWLTDWLIDS